MWITNASPTAPAGSPVALCSMPEASMATWPRGSRTTLKIAVASAGMVRLTSKRSFMRASCQDAERIRTDAIRHPLGRGLKKRLSGGVVRDGGRGYGHAQGGDEFVEADQAWSFL